MKVICYAMNRVSLHTLLVIIIIVTCVSGFFKASPCAENYLTTDCSFRGLINTYNLNIPSETRELNLNRNEFTTLHGNEFLDAGMGKLRILSIQNNRLTKVDQLAFNGVHNLQHLDLSSNLIASLDFLPQTPNLLTLNLSSNPISNEQLVTSISLQVLDLSYCNLRYMPHMDLPLLKHLNLSYNYIHTIQQQDVSSLHHLATLQLIRTPISCDGSSRQAFELLIERSVDFTPICFFTPKPADTYQNYEFPRPRIVATNAAVPSMIVSSSSNFESENCLPALKQIQREHRIYAIITLTMHGLILLILLVVVCGFFCFYGIKRKKKTETGVELDGSIHSHSHDDVPPPPYRQGYLV